MYVWFLLPTNPNFFNRTLNIKMVFGENYLKQALFQILSLFSLLNVITKFNNFPTYIIIIIIIGFLINLQVQGHHPHQWAPFQVTG